MFQFSVLGSGSGGNSALVRSERTAVLVDAGLSARQLTRRIETLEMDPDELAGIVLTHEHGDHTRGLEVFLRERKVPVYGNVRTVELLRRGMGGGIEWRIFESGDRFEVGDLEIQSFYVPHDAVEPMGFVIRRGGGALGVVSDIGHATTLVREHLRGVDSLYVEANYDEMMLQNDTKRPWATKQRIASRHGHLSNAQAAELVEEVASVRLHRVVLGHLSRDCNHPDVATKAVRERLERLGFRDVEVICAEQDEVLAFCPVERDAGVGGGLCLKVREEVAMPEPPVPVPATRSGSEMGQTWTANQESLFEF